MPLLGALLLLVQLSFAIHALKTGRPYWWMMIIMAFPVAGCLIYYFVEVFPNSREARKAHKTARNIIKSFTPDADLKRRAEELEICGSVDNKMALAAECSASGMHPEAARLYESCLTGPFARDGAILHGWARAAIEAADWGKAEAALGHLKEDAPKYRPLDARLLEARLLEGRNQTDAALAAYRELIPQFIGQEARFRYGELLARLGQNEAAIEVFNQLLAQAKRIKTPVEGEEQWVEGAKRAVRA
ncbi:MAG: hypothetical protein JWN73_517 [Betaproteobacteria bacterium]|nr:hypothetical protein [Betaproteobacteria bacterium]